MTTKTKDEGRFTPEPWHQHGLHIHARYESATGVRHYAVVDALSHEGMARGEAEANARLIAAAPDLYDACKTALESLRAWNEMSMPNEMREATKRAYEYSTEIQALKAALAKVEAS